MTRSLLHIGFWLGWAAVAWSAEKPARHDPAEIPYVHATVTEPYPDGIRLDVPPALARQPQAALGLLDVTRPPFQADPTGQRDSTQALQRAIEAARDAQMVCYFPPGRYRVSDTLSCIQQRYRRSNGKVLGGHIFPCLLVGSRVGAPRPRIVLAPQSPGFANPQEPKFVVHFWARGYKNPTKPELGDAVDPEHEQPNISMNQMFVNLDIEIGAGNPGAVGIRHQAAEGSAIEDCTIDATHGLAGIQGGIGSGGGSTGVTVIGGRIGLDFTGYLSGTQPTPTITGFTLIDQTETAIRSTSRQTLVAAGLRISAAQAAGPLIDVPRSVRPNQGQLTLVDAAVTFHGPALAKSRRVVIASSSGVYLHNVFVQGATHVVVDDEQRRELPGNPQGWLHVRQYAHGAAPRINQEREYRYPVYVDGQSVDEIRVLDRGTAPPADLQTRHLWPQAFPHWETTGAANVKSPPYNARGDGRTDDTAALERAIREQRVVFLPKGYYRICRTLELRPDTQLVGVGQHLSVLVPAGPEGDFADPQHPAPLVRTADTASAATILAFWGLFAATDVPGAYALHWRCGGDSIVRALEICEQSLNGFRPAPRDATRPPPRQHPLVQIDGHGGGRWYNFRAESAYQQGENYRHMWIGATPGPLNFYQLSPQHVVSPISVELRGAQHVSIFGTKYEGNAPLIVARDCDQLRLFGHGGNGSARAGDALFVFEGVANFLLANGVEGPTRIAAQAGAGFNQTTADPRAWHLLIDRPQGAAEVKLPPLDRPVLYQRGQVD